MLRYTLLADGSSDIVLMKVVDWLLDSEGLVFEGQFALGGGGESLTARAEQALKEFPCELLIVHRDAEKEKLSERRREITEALSNQKAPPYVCLVPVRMTEAWLLIDERAIRRAAGNPNGSVRLELPSVNRLEGIVDPKAHLYELLLEASELRKRARKKFRPERAVHRLADLIDDYSRLKDVEAFRAFSDELLSAVRPLSDS